MAHYYPSQQPFVRKPITTSILNSLLTALHSTQRWCKRDCVMLRAALCLAFYGFLRGGEFTTPRCGIFNSAIHATPADVRCPPLTYASTLSNQRRINTPLVTQSLWEPQEANSAQYASCASGSHRRQTVPSTHHAPLGATGGKQCPVRIMRLWEPQEANSAQYASCVSGSHRRQTVPSMHHASLGATGGKQCPVRIMRLWEPQEANSAQYTSYGIISLIT